MAKEWVLVGKGSQALSELKWLFKILAGPIHYWCTITTHLSCCSVVPGGPFKCTAAARSSHPASEGHWGHQRPTRFNKFVTVHCTRPRGVYACYRLYLPNFPLLIGHSVTPLSSKSVPTISREHTGTWNIWHLNPLSSCAYTWTALPSQFLRLCYMASSQKDKEKYFGLALYHHSQAWQVSSMCHKWITKSKQSPGGPRASTIHQLILFLLTLER